MAEITYRIPSKAVTYGYVEFQVPATPEASPEMVAAQYVSYVYAFQKEEQATLQRIAEKAQELLNSGLGKAATTDTHEAAVGAIKDGLGATEMEGDVPATGVSAAIEQAAPWDKAVDAKPKPWETEETAKPAISDEW